MPLQYVVLTGSQYRLLAEVTLHPLQDPARGDAAEQEVLARGLDPQTVLTDLPELVFLGLVKRERGKVTVTVLGEAVHYRSLYEAADERLSAVVRLAYEIAESHPRIAHAVRRVASQDGSLEEALSRLRRAD
ncbi:MULTISPECIES: hypothetical protein [Streptomyces]|uniref:hypothetical protein n=1 Tax=Streptomyces TaxID=1883 RepID=UPI0004E6C8F8|nr:hypothetical protein [Streptomyces scabiei]MBP5908880.1 hypothetical protein [Streptomyces sp. LBUM 1478]MBP5927527.1 hypothetical protein [Streptomyces sp. LBUM 1479]KFG10823.1 hypothetical protein IQ61_00910 [Streptomyces scabiei]MDX2532536.1 hypothetical protein [Streptomyces scabiei]MDX2579438.1 hypothetical protein [Streptomyces scabiei]